MPTKCAIANYEVWSLGSSWNERCRVLGLFRELDAGNVSGDSQEFWLAQTAAIHRSTRKSRKSALDNKADLASCSGPADIAVIRCRESVRQKLAARPAGLSMIWLTKFRVAALSSLACPRLVSCLETSPRFGYRQPAPRRPRVPPSRRSCRRPAWGKY